MNSRVRIAILDSGVAADHPHITRPVIAGVTVTSKGYSEGFQDNLGHGTSICALIQKMAPDADIFVAKIFDGRLATSISVVLRGIDWCLHQQIDIINLSLGTTNRNHLPDFTAYIEKARKNRSVIVSAYQANNIPLLPGSIPSVIGVTEDHNCPRESARIVEFPTLHAAACPYSLDISGVPHQRNLHGVSFAVAHVTARVARLWPQYGQDTAGSTDWLRRLPVHQSAAAPALDLLSD